MAGEASFQVEGTANAKVLGCVWYQKAAWLEQGTVGRKDETMTFER